MLDSAVLSLQPPLSEPSHSLPLPIMNLPFVRSKRQIFCRISFHLSVSAASWWFSSGTVQERPRSNGISSWTHHVKRQVVAIGPILVDQLVKEHPPGVCLCLPLMEKYPIGRYMEALYPFFIIPWRLGQVLLRRLPSGGWLSPCFLLYLLAGTLG